MVAFGRFLQMVARQMAYIIYLIVVWEHPNKIQIFLIIKLYNVSINVLIHLKGLFKVKSILILRKPANFEQIDEI